jgi:hypothetical protein
VQNALTQLRRYTSRFTSKSKKTNFSVDSEGRVINIKPSYYSNTNLFLLYIVMIIILSITIVTDSYIKGVLFLTTIGF